MEAVAVADIVVAALVDGFADTELVVGEDEEVEDEVGFAVVAAGDDTEEVALAGAELVGLGVLSAELGESAVDFVGDKQVEPVAQDDMIEVSVVGHVAAAAGGCEEDTQLADTAAEEQVYAAAKCSALVLQPASQQVS